MEQRLSDSKRHKADDDLPTELDDKTSSVTLNAEVLFVATLVLRKSNNTVWLDMLHVDGNRDSSHQVFQFFKNRFV